MRNLEIKNETGRSMIEMLGVLAIIGVLSVGGIAGYSKAMMKYRINKTIEQITLIAGNVRTFFAPQGNYVGLGCACDTNGGCYPSGCPIIKKAKILPDEMITLDSTGKKITAITNPFGGRVGLSVDDKAMDSDSQAFSIYSYKIPPEACIEILTHDWSVANLKATNVVAPLDDCTDLEVKIPATIDTVINVCTAYGEAESGETVNIYFYFDIDLNSQMYKDYSPMNGCGWVN